jgi:hypothetical protein
MLSAEASAEDDDTPMTGRTAPTIMDDSHWRREGAAAKGWCMLSEPTETTVGKADGTQALAVLPGKTRTKR